MGASILDFNLYPSQSLAKPERVENAALRETMRQAAYELPGEPILDGKFHRFATAEDRHNEKSGWYIGNDGQNPSASFGDWRGGAVYFWSAYELAALSYEERAQVEAERARQRALAEAKAKEDYEHCLKTARQMLATAMEPAGHPYLARKRVQAHGIKTMPDGMLVLPIQDLQGNLCGLYRLWDNGEKKPLFASKVKGNFYKIAGSDEAIAITEGFATGASVHESTGWTVFVAWNCGNLETVCRNLLTAYPREKLLICGDDDFGKKANPGRAKAEEAARNLDIKAVFPHFSSQIDNPTDFNDLAVREGLEAVRRQLMAALAPMEVKPRFRLLSGKEVMALDDAEWIIQDVLIAGGIAAMFGAPGGGKSFLVLDMILAIARGKDWFGHETWPCPVVYINQESRRGLKKRLRAWQDANGEEIPENVHFILDPVQVVNDEAALLTLLPKNGLVVVDTLSAVTAGLDENSAKDMGLIIDAVKKWALQTGSTIMFIHHTGKDADKGARGHSSLKGALDAEILVTRNVKNGERRLKLLKNKEGEDGEEKVFHLEIIELGLDKRGKAVSSCIIQEEKTFEAVRQAEPREVKLPRSARLALETLKELDAECKGLGVQLEEWRALYYRRCPADSVDGKKKNFQNGRARLLDDKLALVDNDIYRLIK